MRPGKSVPLSAAFFAMFLVLCSSLPALAADTSNSIRPNGAFQAANGFTPASTDRVYFQDCGHYLGYGFLNFWRLNGGMEMFGCPVSEEITENGRTVQYFQLARFEYHPDLAGTEWETSLGRISAELLQATPPTDSAQIAALQPVAAFPSTDTKVFVDVTKHSIGGGFYTYWKDHGGVYRFGYPMSEEYPAFIDGVWGSEQIFERTRFQFSPSFGVRQASLGWGVANLNKADVNSPGRDPQIPLYNPTLWEHWVDVNLTDYTATFYDGYLPVRKIQVVTGTYGHPTPPGTFTIFRRVANEHMTSASIGAEDFYDLYNVLYTQYFTSEGHALHYAWWRSSFGYPGSHGCVNMGLDDSFFAWNFVTIGNKVNIHY